MLKILFLDYSLGTTGGILIAEIIGVIILNAGMSNNLSAYRNFGLVMFFVGNGILTGQQLNGMIDLKWFAYGGIITLSAVIVGDMLAKLIVNKSYKPNVYNRRQNYKLTGNRCAHQEREIAIG